MTVGYTETDSDKQVFLREEPEETGGTAAAGLVCRDAVFEQFALTLSEKMSFWCHTFGLLFYRPLVGQTAHVTHSQSGDTVICSNFIFIFTFFMELQMKNMYLKARLSFSFRSESSVS